jgi:hypothetical protein
MVPKDTAIIAYKIVHTGPKTQEGGAHEGFNNCAYNICVGFSFELE